MIRSRISLATKVAQLVSEGQLAGRNSHACAKRGFGASSRGEFGGVYSFAMNLAAAAKASALSAMSAMATKMDPMAATLAGEERNTVGRGGLAA